MGVLVLLVEVETYATGASWLLLFSVGVGVSNIFASYCCFFFSFLYTVKFF